MKLTKVMLILVVFLVSCLITAYLLRLIHPIVFSIGGGIGIGYFVYTIILFLMGIWLVHVGINSYAESARPW